MARGYDELPGLLLETSRELLETTMYVKQKAEEPSYFRGQREAKRFDLPTLPSASIALRDHCRAKGG